MCLLLLDYLFRELVSVQLDEFDSWAETFQSTGKLENVKKVKQNKTKLFFRPGKGVGFLC